MAVNWEHYQSFLTVIETHSLSAAARKLGLSQPTLGRHIDALEKSVGATLFVRSRYGLSPTETAQNMVVHARSMASAAASLERAASAGGDTEGTVRLTASEIIGVEVLPRIITAFIRNHPHIRIELALTNRTENLLKREADIAIRMIRPVQEALTARKIGDVPLKLYAHEDYVDVHGKPKLLEEAVEHIIIGPESNIFFDAYSGSVNLEWLISQINIKSDSDLAQLALIRNGSGIGGIQMQLAKRDKSLVPVLDGQFEIPMEMWLAAHEDVINERPIRLLFDHLSKHLGAYVRQKSDEE